MGYPVIVEMFLTGDSKPFIDYKSVSVTGNTFLPVIKADVSPADPKNTYIFNAESSVGANIDWSQVKWTFMDTAEAQYGPVVSHKFPINSLGKTYTVALTLTRRLANGQVESKTKTDQIKIGSNEITPVVRALVYGDYLVLSAEKSTGTGLLLDRAVWAFPGEGENETLSSSHQEGTVKTDSHTISGELSIGSILEGLINLSGSYSYNNQSSESEYETNSESFTSSNYHTGPICRRYAGELRYQLVTLYVYRMTTEGGVEGKSITVNVDLKRAKASAETGGVSYE